MKSIALALACIGLTGCAGLAAGLSGGGPHRSEQFPSGNAPEPTVATTVLACITKALPYGTGDSVTARFDALSRSTMPAGQVPLSPAAHDVLCSTIAASDAFHAWREWNPPPSATAIVREIAQATGAKSVAMPALRLYARCEQDTKTVRDANGVPIATIQENTQTCRLDRIADFGVFLFSADGTIIYRSTKRTGVTSDADTEPAMNEVLANVPATFSGPARGVAAAPPVIAAPPPGPVAASYAPPPAQQGVGPTDAKIDDALGELNAKAPGGCKKFVKSICRSPRVPDVSRLQMCRGYVNAVNQLVARQSAKSADACKEMEKSAP
jgi:hypothetical protein